MSRRLGIGNAAHYCMRSTRRDCIRSGVVVNSFSFVHSRAEAFDFAVRKDRDVEVLFILGVEKLYVSDLKALYSLGSAFLYGLACWFAARVPFLGYGAAATCGKVHFVCDCSVWELYHGRVFLDAGEEKSARSVDCPVAALGSVGKTYDPFYVWGVLADELETYGEGAAF